jgi:hypothetical protein
VTVHNLAYGANGDLTLVRRRPRVANAVALARGGTRWLAGGSDSRTPSGWETGGSDFGEERICP